MNRLLVCLLLVAACTIEHRPDANSATSDSWVVRPDSVGPIPLGVPIAEAARALGDSIRVDVSAPNACEQTRPSKMPGGMSLMALSDGAGVVRIERVDVDSAGVLTAEGAGVGDAEANVIALYRGRVSVQPHKYTGPRGHYLVVATPGDTLHRIIFETDGQRVVNYRAGRRPAVDYVEGCA